MIVATTGQDLSGGFLATFDIDPSRRVAVPVSRAPLGDRALHLAGGDGLLVAAVIDDTVARTDVDADGRLGDLEHLAGFTGLPCHVALDGRRLLVCLYTGGSLAIVDDVRTSTPPRRIRLTPHRATAGSRPHQTAWDPVREILLVCDAGGDSIGIFDPHDMTEIRAVTTPAGSAPRNLVADPVDPTRLFVTYEGSAQVAAYRADGADDLLPLGNASASLTTAPRPAAITAGRAGVYQSNREAGTVATFRLADDPGLPREISTGRWPMSLATVLDDDGDEWLVVGNRDEGTLTWHPVADDGMPQPAELTVAVPGVSALVVLEAAP